MVEKKFTSRDLLRQLRPARELAYEFSNEQVLQGVKDFLRYVGYTLEEQTRAEGELTFSARRKEGDITYKVVGLVRHNMKEVADGIACLWKLRKQSGDETADYVIALPPVQERYLIDYMRADDYKLYKELRQSGFLVWICNPQERSVWCCQGSPRDRRFNEYFKVLLGGDLMCMLATMPYRGDKERDQRQIIEKLME